VKTSAPEDFGFGRRKSSTYVLRTRTLLLDTMNSEHRTWDMDRPYLYDSLETVVDDEIIRSFEMRNERIRTFLAASQIANRNAERRAKRKIDCYNLQLNL
jgi:hypothetical protein